MFKGIAHRIVRRMGIHSILGHILSEREDCGLRTIARTKALIYTMKDYVSI